MSHHVAVSGQRSAFSSGARTTGHRRPGCLRNAHRLSVALALLTAAWTLGCDEILPDVGEPIRGRCMQDDGNPERDESYVGTIAPLFERASGGCAEGCHDPRSANPIGVSLGGLELTSYATLRAGGAQSGSDIIVPGRPCDSALYLKLSANPPFGARMPGDGPPYFSAEELERVHDWIAEGAPEDGK